MTEHSRPRIEIERDGPYHVSGPTRLTRTAIVETERGEPVAWADERDVTVAGSRPELCRCGNSSNKPFCDGSHRRTGFDGTETADRTTTRAERAREFHGKGLTLSDDRSLCDHSGFCTNVRTDVWHMLRDTDDPEVRERLIAMVGRCPSGRIALSPAEGEATEGEPGEGEPGELEPNFDPSVAVVDDGPLWVRGRVEIVGADGEVYEVRNRVALCRCGGSSNKPFCDGTHRENGFHDPT